MGACGQRPPPPGAVRISSEEQTERWVRGESVHRIGEVALVDDRGNTTSTIQIDECTPDFSCCKPHLAVSTEIRQAYAAAGTRERRKLEATFLSALIADAGLSDQAAVVSPDRSEPS